MKAIWFLHWIWGAATATCWFLPWVMELKDGKGVHMEFLFLIPAIGAVGFFLIACVNTLAKKAQAGE